MKLKSFAVASLSALLFGCAATTDNDDVTYVYPETRMVDQVDNYHGTDVADPYRWLEDDVRTSEEVAQWVKAQNEVTQAYLTKLPEREKIVKKLNELWNYERYTTPEVHDDLIFFRKNDGLQNQYVLYVQRGADAEPEVLIDPNTWSDDGTSALASYVVSPKGKYLAYSIQEAGSDWRTWKVMDIATGKILSDELTWLKFGDVAWKEDESGFFYTRFPQPESGQEFQSLNLNASVYYHDIGNAQTDDTLVYANAENPEWGYGVSTTTNGNWLLITVFLGTDSRYQLLSLDISKMGKAKPEFVVKGFDYDYSFIGSREDIAYFRTTLDAPLGRIIAMDLNSPVPANWQEIVPQRDATLSGATLTKNYVLTHYLEDAKSALYVYNKEGKQTAIDLPTIGQIGSLSTTSKSDSFYYSFSSYNYPNTTFKHDIASGTSETTNAPDVKFNPEDFVVKQVFYTSKDGTRVPMTISHLKDVEPNGDLPTLLYGYGGFNISLLPRFSLTRLAWMMMGGVYAQPNIRGGGEYGEAWHQAAVKLKRQNAFDDFISAGEYLIEQGYTNDDKLAVWGGSNGGLLVGTVVNQRPDLFEAALPAVGVMDMLRFQRFTAGRYWVDDYGSSDNPQEFKALYAYSPYHNIVKGEEYPAVMVLTADTDDRVVPGHSFKYAAALQAAQADDDPVLIRIETSAGHGAGVPTEKVIQQYADMWAFLAEELEMESRL
jgi:prolyl oligopeptidase